MVNNIKDLEKQIENRLTEYIGFDINELYSVSDYITIFGGAIRDSIAGFEINDLDILCLPQSAQLLRDFLLKKGFNYFELYDQDALKMYKELSLIDEPWTFINNKKIVQIIKPRLLSFTDRNKTNSYKLAYYNVINNVDITPCGVLFEYQYINNANVFKLKEVCKNAIIQCLTKTFTFEKTKKMYNYVRSTNRSYKLVNRGWINIDDMFIEQHKLENITRKQKLINLDFDFGDCYLWKQIYDLKIESDYDIFKDLDLDS